VDEDHSMASSENNHTLDERGFGGCRLSGAQAAKIVNMFL
jgi:hypothetical protein